MTCDLVTVNCDIAHFSMEQKKDKVQLGLSLLLPHNVCNTAISYGTVWCFSVPLFPPSFPSHAEFIAFNCRT